MRVLALGYTTQDFADEMMDFADQCHKESEWIFDEYKSFRWPEEKTEWIKHFFFPGNVIASTQKEGSNYRIVFKKSVCNDRVKEIIFCNANRLEEDAPLENAVWKHVEIYQIAGGYEIHILLVCGPCVPREPLYLTLTCDDVLYIMAEE